MNKKEIYNVNIESQDTLSTPEKIQNEIQISEVAQENVYNSRKEIKKILNRESKKLILIVGPCSIHDPKTAIDYAKMLKSLSNKVMDNFFIIMRLYFEKPRTTTGWKGLINDPHMNDSFDMDYGLRIARKLLIEINELGLPCGTEALDPISPQYLGELITWNAIGARTTESQTHREMASGLSTPVGFKNGTDGSLSTAINALLSVSSPHSFLGINKKGQVALIKTKGNKYGHVVLRGGSKGPNYDSVSISLTENELIKNKIPTNIIVDCSHANSNKDHKIQPLVMQNCINQITEGNSSIIGLMIESNINEGNQKIPKDLSQLKRGVSVTDACINWQTTEKLVLESYNKVNDYLANR